MDMSDFRISAIQLRCKIKNAESLKPSQEQQPFFTPATCAHTQSSQEAGSTILIESNVD